MRARYFLLPLLIALLGLLGPRATGQEGLNVYLVASSDAVGAGDALDYTLMVANNGAAALDGVAVEVRFPAQMARFNESDLVGELFDCDNFSNCDPNGNAFWAVGTLQPGDNRRITYPTRMASNASPGAATTRVVASAANVSDIVLSQTVEIYPSLLLRLSLVPGPGPAEPGQPFTYMLSYGNVGTTSPTEVTLSMPVPQGTAFVDATGGGVKAGGAVTWALGTVGVGAGGQVEMTVRPDASLAPGATLQAEARIDAGDPTERPVQSAAVTEVGVRGDLQLALSLSQNANGRAGAFGPSGRFAWSVTATNASATQDLENVRVALRFPPGMSRFNETDVVGFGLDCDNFSNCDAEGNAVWSIGTLAARQSRTILLPTSVLAAAQQGEVLRTHLYATADGEPERTDGVDLLVDPSPVVRLDVVPGTAPVAPGASLTYTLLFGNIGFQPAELELTMPIPEGTTFASLTGGGTLEGDVAVWRIREVTEEGTGRVELTVEVDPTAPEGTIVEAVASLTTGVATEYAVVASAATPIRRDVPLAVSYTSSQQATQPGSPIEFTVEASNTGPADLTDVLVEIRLPAQINRFNEGDVIGSGLDCDNFSNCDPDGNAFWQIGTLAPGQTRTIIMPTSVFSGAPQGTFLISPVSARSTGSNEVLLVNEVLLGTEVDLRAPAAPVGLTATPGDGAVDLTWTVNAEPDLAGYRLYRDTAPGATTLLVELDAATTAYTDAGLTSDLYYYRLTAVDAAGNESAFSEEVEVPVVNTAFETEAGLPTAFALGGGYPNPFQHAATIPFDVPEATDVVLAVYAVTGERVAVLADQPFAAGRYRVEWDASTQAAGVYVVQIRAGDFSTTRKLVLLR